MTYDETYLREPEPRGDRDEDGNYINGEETYKDIAWYLNNAPYPPAFKWSDEQGTVLDMMMVYGAEELTPLGEGVEAGNALFVATRFGWYGFTLYDRAGNLMHHSSSHVAENLGINPHNQIAKPLSELINGVAKAITA